MTPYRLLDDTYFNRHEVVAFREDPTNSSKTFIWLRGISDEFLVSEPLESVILKLDEISDEEYTV